MKSFYMSVLALTCLAHASYSHAINIGPITGQLNRLPTVLNPVTQPLTTTTQNTLEKTTDNVNSLKSTLAQLPKKLPILTQDGKTAFVDARVEHGWRAVEREWLVMLDDKDLLYLQTKGIEILEQTPLDDMTLVRIRVSPELDSLKKLKKQLPSALGNNVDRNHIFAAQTQTQSSSKKTDAVTQESICDSHVNIGIIDTSINTHHLAFSQVNEKDPSGIIAQHFLPENIPVPDAHGTAIASLLVGKSHGLQPLLPNATLFSASVFFVRHDSAQGATLMNLVRALNWLATQNVTVINMSLAGPDNQILAKIIAKLIASNHIIVAAVGNEGPAAPALYPAAYPGVIAVTAVDSKQKIYRWANQGNQVAFSALGVNVIAAQSNGGFAGETGTSIAAPVVAAFAACELAQNNNNIEQAIKNLISAAIDLGEKGRDPVFGYGLLQGTLKARL